MICMLLVTLVMDGFGVGVVGLTQVPFKDQPVLKVQQAQQVQPVHKACQEHLVFQDTLD